MGGRLRGGPRPPAVRVAAALAMLGAVALLGGLIGPGAAPASAAPVRRPFPPLRPTRVLVLGDSVMKGAAARYAPALPGRDVVVDAEVNRTTGQGADVVARIGADWDVVVILLGHNDGGTPGAYQPAARRLLDELRGVRRVVWLTIHEVRPYYPAVNQYIAGLQATYPNLRTADWNAVASAHPEGLAADGLHLNGAGAELMAALVADQVHLAELEWFGALRALARAVDAATTTTTAPPTTTVPPTTTTAAATTSTSTVQPPTTTASAATATRSTEPHAADDPDDDGPATDDARAPYALVVGIILVPLAAAAAMEVRRRRRGRSR